jgi:phospholipase C
MNNQLSQMQFPIEGIIAYIDEAQGIDDLFGRFCAGSGFRKGHPTVDDDSVIYNFLGHGVISNNHRYKK